MNSRDRILAAMYLEEPDQVPFYDFLDNPKLLEEISGKKGVRTNGTPEEYLKLHQALHLDMISVYEDGLYETKKVTADCQEDEWGIRWRPQEATFVGFYIGGPIKDEKDLENFRPPDPSDPNRFDTTRSIVKLADGKIAVGGVVAGPFNHTFLLMGGLESFVRNLYLHPSLVTRLIRIVKDYFMEVGKRFTEIGTDVVMIIDDYGQKGGPLMSPKLYRQYIIPALKEMVDSFRKRGTAVFLHSDGNVNLVVEDLIELGIQCLNPIERKAGMDLKQMKESYGERLCLNGNVDATTVLASGDPGRIREQVKECFEIAAPGGGYIFGTDGGEIPPHASAEATRFMFDTALKCRRYECA
jgi:uroporphyrinogen decarboxylase